MTEELMTVVSHPGPSFNLPNDYNRHLFESLAGRVTVVDFSWRLALFHRGQVVHVHWPEALLHSRSGRTRLGKRLAFALLLLWAAIGRITLIWTVHNERPHERPSFLDRWLLFMWRRAVLGEIHLTQETAGRSRKPLRIVIPHGVYSFPSSGLMPKAGALACVGQMRPYKGIEGLIESAKGLPSGSSITIAGEARDAAYARQITRAAGEATNVSLDLRRLTDQELADAIARSSGIVLPYRSLGNSGVAILALCLTRPVLVPAGDAANALRQEAGPGWVYTFDSPLRAEHLIEFSRSAERRPLNAPELSDRDWDSIGRRHAEFIESVSRARR